MTDESEGDPDAPVLTPEELALERAEGVEQIDENRFVVSPSEDRPSTAPATDPDTGEERHPERSSGEADHHSVSNATDGPIADPSQGSDTGTPRSPDDTQPGHVDSDSSHTGTPSEGTDSGRTFSPATRQTTIEQVDRPHAVDILVKSDDRILERRIAAEDRITAFEELLVWYASTIDDDNPPAATISALLAEADLHR